MLSFEETILDEIVVHLVGNVHTEEGMQLSKASADITGETKSNLMKYFLRFVKDEELAVFYHDIDVSFNEVYACVGEIFQSRGSFYPQSINLAKHLYTNSTHPKIKGGEFYVAYFTDCMVDGDLVDAVGLFKSENKDTYLKVAPKGAVFGVESRQGINVKKLDKGCVVFNKEKENGYVVAVVDNTNKGAEAKYWMDDFLQLKPRNDAYNHTKEVLEMAKYFVLHELPYQMEVNKADQIDILNKSVQYFKDNESFSMDEFTQEVMGTPEVIDTFNRYKSEFEFARELSMMEQFDISDAAVKKGAKAIKSVIKLDKNFHIYVHGDRNLIEQGQDEDGRKFYKIYYTEEA